MATSPDDTLVHTFRRYNDGDDTWASMNEHIFQEDTSYKCPTYIQKTPPCQGSCPSGEDIRGWLQIVRGLEKPSADMAWQEYAFRRSTTANPFPAVMGRVCPAPCQDGCNRTDPHMEFQGRLQGFPVLSGRQSQFLQLGPEDLLSQHHVGK